MKLHRAEADRYEFHLGRREQKVFCEVLAAYPVTPLDHHRLSRPAAGAGPDSHQALLTESMQAIKAATRKRLDAFLGNAQRFTVLADGYRVSFTREEMEWLLQVLNDIRVGSWLRLGAPDPEAAKPPQLTPETARYLPLMEIAGHFEFVLLAALDGTDGVGWAPREP